MRCREIERWIIDHHHCVRGEATPKHAIQCLSHSQYLLKVKHSLWCSPLSVSYLSVSGVCLLRRWLRLFRRLLTCTRIPHTVGYSMSRFLYSYPRNRKLTRVLWKTKFRLNWESIGRQEQSLVLHPSIACCDRLKQKGQGREIEHWFIGHHHHYSYKMEIRLRRLWDRWGAPVLITYRNNSYSQCTMNAVKSWVSKAGNHLTCDF